MVDLLTGVCLLVCLLVSFVICADCFDLLCVLFNELRRLLFADDCVLLCCYFICLCFGFCVDCLTWGGFTSVCSWTVVVNFTILCWWLLIVL